MYGRQKGENMARLDSDDDFFFFFPLFVEEKVTFFAPFALFFLHERIFWRRVFFLLLFLLRKALGPFSSFISYLRLSFSSNRVDIHGRITNSQFERTYCLSFLFSHSMHFSLHERLLTSQRRAFQGHDDDLPLKTPTTPNSLNPGMPRQIQ